MKTIKLFFSILILTQLNNIKAANPGDEPDKPWRMMTVFYATSEGGKYPCGYFSAFVPVQNKKVEISALKDAAGQAVERDMSEHVVLFEDEMLINGEQVDAKDLQYLESDRIDYPIIFPLTKPIAVEYQKMRAAKAAFIAAQDQESLQAKEPLRIARRNLELEILNGSKKRKETATSASSKAKRKKQ